MPEIHIPTVFLFAAVLALCLGALMLWLWWRDRGQTALASWGSARLLGSAGLFLAAERGIIHERLSLDLANAAICLAYGLTWCGARQFEGRRVYRGVVLAGAALWLVACQFPVMRDNLSARVMLIGLISACYNGLAMREFILGQRRAPLGSRPLVIALLGIITTTYAACAILPALLPFMHSGTSLPQGSWFGMVAILSILFLTCGALLLVALTKEQAEARSNAALATARDVATQASAHKTRFLSRMSHELRTPLNGVLGLAQALRRDPSLGAMQQRQAATLEEAGRHLLEILNEVLDIARIEAGKFEPVPTPLRLDDFLRGTFALMDDAAAGRGVALRLRLDPALPQTVLADRLRLRQILMNLLSNGIKFTPAGGSVTVDVGRQEQATAFRVTDTGSGVPAALRSRLFQDFVQAAQDDSRSSSGLGLAISAQLARAMGGSLAHADGPGGLGSCFTLTMPLPAVAVAAEVAVPAAPGVMPAQGGLRILVVDDIAANRMVAHALLSQAGHLVTEAAGGAEALAALERGPLPDLLLLDENMPGMDGRTTARHIRAMAPPAGDLPILALTADALPEQVAAMLDAGFDGHLAKPVERDVLLAAVLAAAGPRRRGRRDGAAPAPAALAAASVD